MNKRPVVFPLLLLFVGAGFAQSVDLSGTVTSGAGGAALANVNVTLKKRTAVTAATGADGTYHLTAAASVIAFKSGPQVFSTSRLCGSVLEFGVTGDNPVAVEIYSACGSKVATLVNQNHPAQGNYSLDLAGQKLAPAMCFIRYRQGTESTVYQYVPVNYGHGSAGGAGSKSTAVFEGLQKSAIAMIDTLLFTLSGYVSAQVPVSAYTGQYDAVLQPLPAGSAPAGMKLIPAGSFIMGTTDPNCFHASPPHKVNITYAFYVDTIEVTQKDFKLLLNNADPAASSAIGDNLPVVGLNWNDAILYCNARSKRDKRDTVYSYSSVVGTPGLDVWQVNNVKIDVTKNGYRLPSEAEWEYFARAGTSTKYYWGDTFDDSYCWYYNNSGGKPHPCGTKKPNNWGLYDIAGNVWEFTNDWWAEGYPSTAQTDPTGPGAASDATMLRALRGGAWGPNDDNIDFMMVAMRGYDAPSWGAVLQYGIRAVCRQ